MKADWLILQLADSAFPAGGFAHSGGLEAAWQEGLISSDRTVPGAGIIAAIRALLQQSARGAAPFVAAVCRDAGRFEEADEVSDGVLSNHVANRASRSQGQTWLTASSRVFSDIEVGAMASSRLESGKRRPLHFAPVFGFVAAKHGLDASTACSLFLFLTLRSLISAAVRLGIAGPLQGQSIQARLSQEAGDLVRLTMNLELDDVAMTTPLLDLAKANHDRLYSRLFQS